MTSASGADIIKMNRHVSLFSLVIILVLIDQFSKWIIAIKMVAGQGIPVFRNILHVTYLQNTGAGFGILKSQTLLLIWVSVIAVGIILFYFDKIIAGTSVVRISGALLLSGTIGNLIDRAFLGYVIDFIDFRIWPVFNLADSFLTIGCFGIGWVMWQHDKSN